MTGTERATDDDLQYYPTPRWAVEALTKHLDLQGRRVLDPCAGTGAILGVARDAGAEVRGYELDEMRAAMGAEAGLNIAQGDGLVRSLAHVTKYSVFEPVVLCNAPFRGRSWWPWAEMLSKFRESWLLLPNTVFSAKKHQDRLKDCRPHVIPGRVSYTGDTPSWGCAWWFCGTCDDPLYDMGWLL